MAGNYCPTPLPESTLRQYIRRRIYSPSFHFMKKALFQLVLLLFVAAQGHAAPKPKPKPAPAAVD